MSASAQQTEGAGAPRVRARLWARVAALGVDWILASGCMLVAAVALWPLVALAQSMWDGLSNDLAEYVLGYSAVLLGGATYWLISLRRLGRSPGRMLLGLRCVRSSGAPLGPWRLLMRELVLKFIPTLLTWGLWLALCWLVALADSERHRALHDHMSDTSVEWDTEQALAPAADRERAEPSPLA